MNQDLFELWGRTLLEMAKMAKGTQAFFDLFQNGFAKKGEGTPKYDSFMDLFHQMFGKEGIERFNALMKEFYENVGVVPRTEYNELQKRYVQLQSKIRELEDEIEGLKKKMEDRKGSAVDLMDEWTKTVQKYAEINKQFFKEFSKFFQ